MASVWICLDCGHEAERHSVYRRLCLTNGCSCLNDGQEARQVLKETFLKDNSDNWRENETVVRFITREELDNERG